ncbi:outer membrane beta-barrel family protein [Flavisolibacter tropicus]|uniref:Outer membrane protein beta-barrel domain-containing protein n=1 Tax=Flavisolibacter tropicus TaxID=1492898 RepID=A0A172TQ58_9BACT|nr:outer membrane beta-barrel family protein [Flavisolibacter tropicus]ANE49168.1 hypothetical protein SY85_00265 [Flavisolibacter tropicus]
MCKRILSFLFLAAIIVIQPISAQERAVSCLVNGWVKNKAGNPVAGASIQVVEVSDSSKVQTLFSLTDGSFEIKNQCNQVLIKVTMTGYETYTQQSASTGKPVEIILKESYQNLSAVEVKAGRRNIEVRTDRMVVNVEAAASNAGTNVLELLEKSPGIAIDQDGVISMQGKQGVMVMIDGKRSPLNAAELAALLRSLSSAQVDQIELITQPSARYDATGNAGVINIKLKRSKTAAFNGNMTTSITQGRYTRLNQSIAIDQRVGKAVLSLGYTGAYNKGFYDLTIKRKFANSSNNKTDYFEQHTLNPFTQVPHNLRLNVDYAFNKRTSLSLNNTLFLSSYKDAPETNGASEEGNSKHFDQSSGINSIRRTNYSIGANFRTILDSTGRELSIDGDFFSYNRKNNQSLLSEQLDEDGNRTDVPYHLKGYNPSFIQIAAGKMDYVHPFSKRWKVETGLKYSAVTTENTAVFVKEINGTWEPDERGRDFAYAEKISAAYLNLSMNDKRWKVLAGLRAEATDIQAQASGTTDTRSSHYFDLFPSLSVNYEKGKGQVLSLYYSRRIDRPDYQDMNPFQFVFNRYTYMQGNPGLMPQYTNLIEACYAFKTNFNVKASYSYTNDVIGNAIIQNDVTRIAYQQKINMTQRTVFSLNSTLVIPVSKRWSSTIFGNTLYTSFKGRFNNAVLNNEAYSFNFNLNNQFRFNKGWSAELSSSYFHKNYYTALFLDKGVHFVNAGVAKQVLGGKGSVRVAARDIFHTQYNRFDINFNTLNVHMKQRQDMSSFTIAFMYRFGKTAASARKSGALEEINRVGAN